MVIDCPHCGEPTPLVPFPKRNPVAVVLVIGSIMIAMLVLIAAGATLYLSKSSKTDAAGEAPSANPPPAHTNVPAAAPGQFTGLNDFKVGKVTLKKADGSSLVYAVGTLKNDTSRQRFGVKIQLDLLDAQGAKIGTASDYVQILDPHKDWQFRALVTDAKAAGAKPVAVEEQK